MKKIIPFAKVSLNGRELEYIQEVLDSGWLTTASKAQAFEKRFRERVGARFAFAVNSCTAALHLALEALGIGPGDEVLVPTMTFTATAEVVRYLGADPVFLDVANGTALVTLEILAAALKEHSQAKAFVPVHFGGQAAPLLAEEGRGLLELCHSQGIRVVEDAAHAFPTLCRGRMVGSIGDVTCFSFYANKTITTGEGGMLTTDDEAIAQRVKIMRLHGIDRDIWDRYNGRTNGWEYDVVAPGYKYNLPDILAAIGLAQLEQADSLRRERERCARYYLDHLGDTPGLDLPQQAFDLADHSWHLFYVILKDKAPLSQNRFIEAMSEQGIGTSVHYKPLHRMTYYRERYGLRAEDFPNAEKIWQGCVSLPIYPSLTEYDLDYICSTIKKILK
jgi:dTDP-4-amino-4,6-dideoxygalactose transaminase